MSLQDVIDSIRAGAISDLLMPTEEYVWRRFCRAYSKTFHTPLHQVLEMEPAEVILAIEEERYEGIDITDKAEELLEIIYSIEDPNYEFLKKKELEEIDKKIMEDEAERIRLGKPIHPAMKSTENSIFKNEKSEGQKIYTPLGGYKFIAPGGTGLRRRGL